MFLVFAATVLAREAGEQAKYHLDFFWSYKEAYIQQRSQIAANILMFVPIGVLLGVEKSVLYAVCGLAFSCFIEISQLITHRGLFELDDILNNTIGLMIGFILVVGIKRIAIKRVNLRL